jgi:hypothetical protein
MKLGKLTARDEKLLKGVRSGRSIKNRTCLLCGKTFKSNGPGHRRCHECQHECQCGRVLSSGCVDLVPHMLGRDYYG